LTRLHAGVIKFRKKLERYFKYLKLSEAVPNCTYWRKGMLRTNVEKNLKEAKDGSRAATPDARAHSPPLFMDEPANKMR